MKLTELEPRWLNAEKTVFAFRCPHCAPNAGPFITCKSVPLTHNEQLDLMIAAQLEPTGPRYGAIATVEGMAWTVSEKDFATMTVTPSIDASRAGHWHGFITNGEVR